VIEWVNNCWREDYKCRHAFRCIHRPSENGLISLVFLVMTEISSQTGSKLFCKGSHWPWQTVLNSSFSDGDTQNLEGSSDNDPFR